jgi:hypothetical protein
MQLIETMPKSDSPKMVKTEIYLPAPLVEQALALAEAEGIKPGELHRFIWVLGLADYSERANKRMVAQGLLRKQRAINDAQ